MWWQGAKRSESLANIMYHIVGGRRLRNPHPRPARRDLDGVEGIEGEEGLDGGVVGPGVGAEGDQRVHHRREDVPELRLGPTARLRSVDSPMNRRRRVFLGCGVALCAGALNWIRSCLVQVAYRNALCWELCALEAPPRGFGSPAAGPQRG